MASLYLKTGEGGEAEQLMRDNAQAAQRLGLKSRQYASSLQQLSFVLQQLGKTDDAIKTAKQALTIAEDAHAAKPSKVADFYDELGLILLQQRKHDAAIQSLKRAVQLREMAKPISNQIGQSLIFLGQAYLAANNWPLARATLERGRERSLDFSKPDWASRANALLAETELKAGNVTAARKLLVDAAQQLRRFGRPPTNGMFMSKH